MRDPVGMNVNFRTVMYDVLSVLIIIATIVLILIGMITASDQDYGQVMALSLLSLIPMFVVLKIYNDLKRLIIDQEKIEERLSQYEAGKL